MVTFGSICKNKCILLTDNTLAILIRAIVFYLIKVYVQPPPSTTNIYGAPSRMANVTTMTPRQTVIPPGFENTSAATYYSGTYWPLHSNPFYQPYPPPPSYNGLYWQSHQNPTYAAQATYNVPYWPTHPQSLYPPYPAQPSYNGVYNYPPQAPYAVQPSYYGSYWPVHSNPLYYQNTASNGGWSMDNGALTPGGGHANMHYGLPPQQSQPRVNAGPHSGNYTGMSTSSTTAANNRQPPAQQPANNPIG